MSQEARRAHGQCHRRNQQHDREDPARHRKLPAPDGIGRQPSGSGRRSGRSGGVGDSRNPAKAWGMCSRRSPTLATPSGNKASPASRLPIASSGLPNRPRKTTQRPSRAAESAHSHRPCGGIAPAPSASGPDPKPGPPGRRPQSNILHRLGFLRCPTFCSHPLAPLQGLTPPSIRCSAPFWPEPFPSRSSCPFIRPSSRLALACCALPWAFCLREATIAPALRTDLAAYGLVLVIAAVVGASASLAAIAAEPAGIADPLAPARASCADAEAMAVQAILRMGDARLLEPAAPLPPSALPELAALIADLFRHDDRRRRVGLAAPRSA